jgi:hypothetical protein
MPEPTAPAPKVYNFENSNQLTIGLILVILTAQAFTLWHAHAISELVDQVRVALATGVPLTQSQASRLTINIRMTDIFATISHLCAGIVLLVWFYRIHANAHAMSTHKMDNTPGWAVGFWFIPIANFVMPCSDLMESTKVFATRTGRKSIGALIVVTWIAIVSYTLVSGILNAVATLGENMNVDEALDLLEVSATCFNISLIVTALGITVIILTNRACMLCKDLPSCNGKPLPEAEPSPANSPVATAQ